MSQSKAQVPSCLIMSLFPGAGGSSPRGSGRLSPIEGLGASAPKVAFSQGEGMANLALQGRGREKKVTWKKSR